MKIVKIDIIQGQIIKTFDNNSELRLNIVDLNKSQNTLFLQCKAVVDALHPKRWFVSLNYAKPIDRLVFFFNDESWKEYYISDMPVKDQELFQLFINI